ncbi:MAG: S66 peptidase family protein [Flavobacterium sp.]
MTTPPHLKPHDRVGIVSTAKRTEPHEIAQGLAMLQSWGLVPVIAPNAFNEYGFLAGTDAERLADLQQMLDDDDIKAIFFTKGGYGTLRIIDGINWDKFRQNPKWLVGYSDITLLHCHVHNFGIQSLHGVMLQGYTNATFESIESIRKILFGESLEYQIPTATDNRVYSRSHSLQSEVKNGDVITGTLVGGNLSMLYAVVGSESDIDTNGKILFIEDIDEYRYHYDRMLMSLKRAGKLSGLKAVIVGDMTDIKDSTLPWGRDYREITFEHFDCPVYFDFPAGHISDNRALIMGATVKIKPSSDSIDITFL